jgi:hypothetical protein
MAEGDPLETQDWIILIHVNASRSQCELVK